MKKTAQLCAAVLASMALAGAAQAATSGTYAGLGIGASKLQTPTDVFNPNLLNGSTSSSAGGVGGRVFAGYNFNQYLGLEAGYAIYARSLEKGSTVVPAQNSSIKYTLNALDLVGKGYLPLGESNFDLYALAGVARVSSTTKYNNGGVPLASGITAPQNGTHTVHKLRPKFGAGVSYSVTPNLGTSIEYSRIQGSGNMKTNSNAVPNADMLAVTISYNFG